MNGPREEILAKILVALARQAGGVITLTQSELEGDMRGVIDTDDTTGVVTVVALPDYVALEEDKEPGPINPEFVPPVGPVPDVYKPIGQPYSIKTDTKTEWKLDFQNATPSGQVTNIIYDEVNTPRLAGSRGR